MSPRKITDHQSRDKPRDAAELRRQAKARLKKSKKAKPVRLAAQDETRVLHELKVHQIELEMQNEELARSQTELEAALALYNDLYDFAPVGYFTLKRDKTIGQVNLTGARLLGVERARLVDRRFELFVSDESRPAFKASLKKVFESRAKEVFEVSLLSDKDKPLWVHIVATCSEDGQACHTVVVDISERKQAETARRESEKNYRDLVETMSEGLGVQDKNGLITFMNKQACEMLGYELKELIGKPAAAMFDEENQAILREQMARRRRGIRQSYEIAWRHKDGRRVHTIISPSSFFDDRGNFEGSVAVITNITERKQAEEQLQYQATLLANVDDAIVASDSAYRLTAWNTAAESLYGWKAAEVLGRNGLEIVRTEWDAVEADEMRRTIAETGRWRGEATQARKDGTRFPVEVSSIVLRAESGQITGYVSVNHDITERKQAQVALRENEKRFRALIENSADVISLLDANGSVLYESSSYSRVMGYPEQERMGRNAFELVHPQDRENLQRLFAEILQKPGRVAIPSTRVLHGDGSWHWIEGVADNLLAEPSIHAIVVNFRDITERKRVDEELRQLSKKDEEALRVARMGHWEFDIATGHFIFNDQYYSLHGTTALGAGGYLMSAEQFASTYVHPSDARLVAAAIQQAIETEDPDFQYQIEARILRADGEPRDVTVWFRVERDAQGRAVKLHGVNQDITARKRIEEALQQSELKYRRLHETMTDAFVLVDMAGHILECNRSFQDMLGYTEAELRQLTYADITPEKWRAFEENIVQEQILVHDFSGVYEKEYWRKDSTIIPVELRVSLIRDDAGQPAAMSAIVRDITDRKKAEDAQREINETLQALIRAAPVGVVVLDPAGNVKLWNPASEEIFGWSECETLGKFLPYVPEDKRAEHTALRDRVLAGESFTGVQVRRLRKDGSPIDLSVAAAPLRDAQGKITGIMGVNTDITERKQRERELEAIATVSSALRVASTRAEMLPVILDQLLALLNVEGAALAIRDSISGETVIELARGEFAKGLRPRIAPGEGVSGAVIASGKPFVTNDIRKESGVAQPDAFETVRAVACVPLTVKDQVIGAVWVGRQSEISTGEVRLLTSLADIAANAIHRETLHEQTFQQLDRLAALHTIDQAISSNTDLRVTLDIFLAEAIAQLDVAAAEVLLLNPHLRTLEFASRRGFRTKGLEHSSLRVGEGLPGLAVLERRIVGSDEWLPPRNAPPDTRDLSLDAAEGFVAFLSVPLIAKGKIQGVLEIFHRAPLRLSPAWLDFLETLSEQAAIAIDNASLSDRLNRSNIELSLAYDTTLEGWSRALDLRDKETEGHTLRVTETTVRLARAMGLGDDDLAHVRRGGLLHDIGKMGIPDAILLKPGPLTDEERVTMRQHPVFAYELLSPINYLRDALDIPYCHHEKWDGTGYPRGLKGEQIPLTARIFAIVDVWDALRSDRSYRKAWTEEKTREYIQSLSGAHFDPKVVAVFLKEIGN